MVIRTNKKKPKFSKVIVVALLVTVLLFTVANMVIFCVVGAVPDALIAAFFAFVAGEAGVLGLIKHADTKYKKAETMGDE